MGIKVRFHGRIRDLVGKDEIEIEKESMTVRELINEIIKALGDKAKGLIERPEDIVEPRTRVVLVINGFSVKMLGDLDKRISEIDQAVVDHIDVMDFMGGG